MSIKTFDLLALPNGKHVITFEQWRGATLTGLKPSIGSGVVFVDHDRRAEIVAIDKINALCEVEITDTEVSTDLKSK